LSEHAATHAALPEHVQLPDATVERLTYQRPELPPIDEIARYYSLSEEARYYSNGGPCYKQLAQRLTAYVGGTAAAAVPVSNCTVGLMVALQDACGEPAIGEAPLIAVPSFTFTATACAIRWAGFRPLFVDVEEDSWQLDPAALQAAIEQHPGEVKGVLACSTFGTAPPASTRAGWRSVCAQWGLPLLLDSAAGFGATDADGSRLGSLGETEIFSFHATKPFAIGEGGAVVTADPALAQRLESTINFGIDPVTRVSTVAGLNGKLSELHCATALAMLDRYDEALARRQQTARQLRDRLAHLPVSYQLGSAGSTWQVFQVAMPDQSSRDEVVAAAANANVEVRTCFDPPLHRHPAFAADPRAGTLPVTERIAARALSLPLANTLGERQMVRLQRLLDQTLRG
jgi:dTDP-4-amino-4,6-dideoxygalactose transaminase